MTRPRRTTRALAALVAVTALLAACSTKGEQDATGTTTTTTAKGATSTTAGSSTTAPTAGTLDWKPCDDGECATLEVPVDYAQPKGKTLELALTRRPAAKPAERIGAILVNPGGPGGSGIELASYLPFPDDITDRFDIVGFDPRGVGESTPLDCHSHLQEIYDADPTMEDAADRAHYIEVSQKFVDECKAKYADLLPHLGTVDVARDMDQIRAAMGDDKLNYVGYSYGTSIGEQYARLFPTRVRAMVLDGVVDPSQTGLEAAAGQAQGFTSALNAFIASCDTDGCGLDGPASQVIDEVIAASEKAPIPAPGADRPATPGVVALGMGQAMYQEVLWPSLGRALTEARGGDGTGLVNLADDYLGRDPDGSYSGGFEIYFAVSCIDSQWPKDPDAVLAEGKKVGQRYPRVGEALVNDYLRCALWPTPPQPLKPVPTDLKGLPPIVVISTTNDPATPYESGVRVAEQIPDARLLTNVGEGHTIYANGKPCIDDTVNTYLLDLTAPEDGKRCE